MISDSLLIDIFLYFARFPQRDGIFPMFNAGASSVTGYNELQKMVNEMPEHSYYNISNYIFGANFEAVQSRVNNIPAGENFLFIDFGEIDCDIDNSNRQTDSARLAITVAYRVKSFSADLIEQTLAFSHTLTQLVQIRNRMIREQQCHPWLKDISKSHTFVPFISQELSSIGWTILFNRQGYDSFKVKNR